MKSWHNSIRTGCQQWFEPMAPPHPSNIKRQPPEEIHKLLLAIPLLQNNGSHMTKLKSKCQKRKHRQFTHCSSKTYDSHLLQVGPAEIILQSSQIQEKQMFGMEHLKDNKTLAWQHFRFPPQAAKCKGVLPAPTSKYQLLFQTMNYKETVYETINEASQGLNYRSTPIKSIDVP